VANTVEKLFFRSCSKNSRLAEALLLLERGGPCVFLLRATYNVLANSPTIPQLNRRLQCALARIRGEYNLEFFNSIGHKRSISVVAKMSRKRTLCATLVRLVGLLFTSHDSPKPRFATRPGPEGDNANESHDSPVFDADFCITVHGRRGGQALNAL